MKKKKSLRILAAVTGCLLLGTLIWLYVGFNGNPISQMIAGAKIRNYVEDTYPGQGYEVSAAQYNFKTGGYGCKVELPGSQDEWFRVSYGGGEIRDDYEMYVTDRMNTVMRLEDELEAEVEKAVAERYSGDYRLLMVTMVASEEEQRGLELDRSYPPEEFPFPVEVTIWTSCEEPGWDMMAERLVELDKLMKELGLEVERYSMSLETLYKEDENGAKMPVDFSKEANIYEFPEEEVSDSPELVQKLKEHREAWEKEQEEIKEQERLDYEEDAALNENNS